MARSGAPVAKSMRRGGGRPEGVRGGCGHDDVSGDGGEATLGRPCGAPARGAGHGGHGGVATRGLAPGSSCREAVEAPGEGPTTRRRLPGGQASAGAVRHCFGFFGITSSASSARGERNGGGGARHGVWRRGGGAIPAGLPWLWSGSAELCTCRGGLGDPGVSPCRHSCRWTRRRRPRTSFPCWGRHVGDTTLLHRFLWVKTLSSPWTSDGGAFGVVPSLEASSQENRLGFGFAGPLVMDGNSRGWQVRRVESLMGVAKPTWRRSWLW